MTLSYRELDRELAKNKGFLVIVPRSPGHIVVLENGDDVLVELRMLSEIDDTHSRYGIVATAKKTGKRKVILEAIPYYDGQGVYFAFTSALIVHEAIRYSQKWVSRHMQNMQETKMRERARSFLESIARRTGARGQPPLPHEPARHPGMQGANTHTIRHSWLLAGETRRKAPALRLFTSSEPSSPQRSVEPASRAL